MNRIKKLREEFGMTQQELADKINGAKSTIAMYENETRKPSMEVLIKLSEIFNCSIDYLLGKSDKRNIDDKKEELEINWALNGGYSALNDANREIAKSVIESLLAKQEQEKKEGK